MPYQTMDNLFRAVVAAPKAQIDRREQEWRKQQGRIRSARALR